MKLNVLAGATNYPIYVFIQDSSSATGAGLTGLLYNTGSLSAYYVRPLGTATSISLVTQTVTGAYSSGGFVEVSSANMPGIYRLDVPNAAIAGGVSSVVIMLKGAANMAPLPIEIQLVANDPGTVLESYVWNALAATYNTALTLGNKLNSAATGTDPWGTAVPGAYGAGTAGFLLGTNVNATISSRSTYAGGAVASVTGNVGGNVVGSVGSLTTNNDKTGYSLAASQFQIKKNQALSNFTFPMFSSSTNQMVTGKTVTSVISKDGAALVSTTNAVIEVGGGIYKLDLAAGDLNANTIILKLTASGCNDLPITFVTQA